MPPHKGQFDLTLEGRGLVTVRESNYVAAGGEAAIYRLGATAIKVYHDADKMTREGTADKITLIARTLQRDGIVAPQGLAIGPKGPVGYYMPFVTDYDALARFFVTDHRLRIGFGDKDAVALSADMHDIMAFAHSQNAIMVDANELNWMVRFAKGDTAKAAAVDVDSWAIGRWKATVIMPSIRDWSSSAFDERTDWFAWGVVTFQIFTGIHPFKGRVDGYKPAEFVKRMQDGASVFDTRARMPASVRDFSCIPAPLLSWYEATFQHKNRSIPPSPFAKSAPAKAARIARVVTTGTGALMFEKLFQRPGANVVRVWPNGAALLDTTDIVDLATGRMICGGTSDVEIVRVGDAFLRADILSGEPQLYYCAPPDLPQRIPYTIATQRFFRAGERLFAVTDRELLELRLNSFSKPMVTVARRYSARPQATQWFDGVAVQDVLGAMHLLLPIGEAGMVQPRVRELDGLTVIAAKARDRFVALTALDAGGTYRKIEITFDKTHATYSAWLGAADGPDLNMGILPKGVVGTIVEDGEIVLFVPTNGNLNKIKDRAVSTALRLATWGDRLVYLHDGAVWRLRVKTS